MSVIPFRYSGRVRAYRMLTHDELIAVESVIYRRTRELAMKHRGTGPAGFSLAIDVEVGTIIEQTVYECTGIDTADMQPQQFDGIVWGARGAYAETRSQILKTWRAGA